MVYAGSAWRALVVAVIAVPLNVVLFGIAAWLPPLRKRLEAEFDKFSPQARAAVLPLGSLVYRYTVPGTKQSLESSA